MPKELLLKLKKRLFVNQFCRSMIALMKDAVKKVWLVPEIIWETQTLTFKLLSRMSSNPFNESVFLRPKCFKTITKCKLTLSPVIRTTSATHVFSPSTMTAATKTSFQ